MMRSRFDVRHWLAALCILSLLLAALPRGGALAQPQPVRIIFLHHSCGENLINQGGVREGLTALGYEFYDHGYNGDGLRLADGSYSGTNFDVPDDNTDPDGLAAIFSQPLHDPPDNTFSHLMQYDVIAFKSCFPTSNIGSDEQLADYQSYYLTIRDRADQYPEKLFIIVTQPPQVPANSDPEEAARARAFTLWLQSDEYLEGHLNLFVFDFFGYLAGDDNFLRPEYRSDEYDAHPNERANQTIGPLFVEFVNQAIIWYWGVQAATTPMPIGETPSTAGELLDDFEEDFPDRWAEAGEGSTVTCVLDSEAPYDGNASLRMEYSLAPGGWADCGRAFPEPRDGSASSGLQVWLRADPATEVTLILHSGPPEEPTPFEFVCPAAEEWAACAPRWSDFARAEWSDQGHLDAVDPTQLDAFSFSLGAGDEPSQGQLWADDLSLTGVTVELPVVVAEGGEEEPVEEEPGRSLCPLSTLALPAAALVVLLARRR